MTDKKPQEVKKNIPARESISGPRQMNGSQEGPSTTSASIGTGKPRPKTD